MRKLKLYELLDRSLITELSITETKAIVGGRQPNIRFPEDWNWFLNFFNALGSGGGSRTLDIDLLGNVQGTWFNPNTAFIEAGFTPVTTVVTHSNGVTPILAPNSSNIIGYTIDRDAFQSFRNYVTKPSNNIPQDALGHYQINPIDIDMLRYFNGYRPPGGYDFEHKDNGLDGYYDFLLGYDYRNGDDFPDYDKGLDEPTNSEPTAFGGYTSSVTGITYTHNEFQSF